MVVLARDEIEVTSWPLAGWGPPDLEVVDRLAGLQLTAGRLGCSVRVRDPCVELVELLELLGLGELVL